MVSFTMKYDDFPQFCGENKNLTAQPFFQNRGLFMFAEDMACLMVYS